jgi:hypothetical protein|tara:strand:+ start:114 stop:521 length:408 start_codon:yes stop_codon:yes gene_type:complete
MGILDVNLNDAEELKTLKDGEEVMLRIGRAEETPNRNDPSRFNLALTFDVPDDKLVDDIRVWLPIPSASTKEDDPKRYVKQVNRFKQFCDCFGIDTGGSIQTEDMLGLEGWVIIAEDTGLNGEPQNSVRRFIKKK